MGCSLCGWGNWSLIGALHKLMKEEKIKISMNSEVTKILTEKDKVTGIEVNNSNNYFADKIIINADPAFTYKNLIKTNYNRK